MHSYFYLQRKATQKSMFEQREGEEMTFLEKAKEMNIKMTESEIVDCYCPKDLELERVEDEPVCYCGTVAEECRECWNREMTNTETEARPLRENDYIHIGEVHGMNEVWEFMNKWSTMAGTKCMEIFGTTALSILTKQFTPQEALAKLKAYEDSKNRVQVGDVIKTPVGNAVVTYVREEEYIAITSSGAYVRLEGLVAKTGKHIDIQSILEQLKGE